MVLTSTATPTGSPITAVRADNGQDGAGVTTGEHTAWVVQYTEGLVATPQGGPPSGPCMCDPAGILEPVNGEGKKNLVVQRVSATTH